jgi:hypothetical protein
MTEVKRSWRNHVWPLPSGRWLALAIGQADPEWPFELLAAVGEASSLPQ